jgi:hypothetical protein
VLVASLAGLYELASVFGPTRLTVVIRRYRQNPVNGCNGDVSTAIKKEREKSRYLAGQWRKLIVIAAIPAVSWKPLRRKSRIPREHRATVSEGIGGQSGEWANIGGFLKVAQCHAGSGIESRVGILSMIGVDKGPPRFC